MSLFSSLEIGKRSLLAQRYGIDVTSNNIANVNTEGYSRRQVVFSETNPTITNFNYLGSGVVADKLRTFREEYVDKEIRNTISKQAFYEEDEKTIEMVETILAEPSENGISELVTEFFNAFENLAGNPEDVASREYLLGVAGSLVDRFHTMAQQLSDTRNDISNDISANINSINQKLSNIAELNTKIASSKTLTGSDVQTLIDQREKILEELSEIVDINVSSGDNGQVNVAINGIGVVNSTNSSKLKVNEVINETTGERTIKIVNVDNNDNVLNNVNPQSGQLASQLKHYNVTMDDKDTSGGYSIIKKLDEFANAFVSNINEITVNGYGLDDTDSLTPGRYFFKPTTGTVTASNIDISDDIKNNPRDIPLSDSPNEPGNGELALKLGNLANDSTFIDGMTPIEFYSGFLGKIATMGNEAANGNSTSTLISEQLTTQRDSVSGVSIDEEGINLIKYQNAFEASSRIVNTINELLNTVVNLGK